MKKKFILVISIVLVMSLMLTLLAGCDDIFKKNTDRDAKQIVSTINYNGQTANVYKHEFVQSFNAYAPTYVQYYGMTYDEAAEYILRSLSQRELLLMFAKEYVVDESGFGKTPSATKVEELLSNSEIDQAIKNTNEDLLGSLENIVKAAITEFNYNKGDEADDEEKTDEKVEVTDPVYVRFDSVGGGNVERQKIQKNTKAEEPSDPTKTGYFFYGWSETEYETGVDSLDSVVYFDFDSKVSESKFLYAVWETYTAPRTARPVLEETEEEFDPDAVLPESEIRAKFFSDEYVASIDFSDKDFYKQIEATDTKTVDQVLADYIKEGLSTLKTNLGKSYSSFDILVESQMETLLMQKAERMIGQKVEDETLSDANKAKFEREIQNDFDRLVAQNKETFSGKDADKNYESALGSAIDTTYYHTSTYLGTDVNSYGFVLNILMKLDQDSVDELVALVGDGNVSKEIITARRDELIDQMTVKISNPMYDVESEVDYGKDKDGNQIEADAIRDPMTDPSNPFNKPNTEYNKDNDYAKLVSFEFNQDKDEWEIVFNAEEAPSMPYLLQDVRAMGTNGIVEQIYNSYLEVQSAVSDPNHPISMIESTYWLKEMATTWLYLVGDDAGSVNTESNNGGLGYMVTPEGKDSSFIPSFTEQSRALIKNGSGSFTIDGTQDGSYIVADSFIENGVTSGAYAGIFMVFASKSVWDSNAYTTIKDADGNVTGEQALTLDSSMNGILPMDIVLNPTKNLDDAVTVYDVIRAGLLETKKTEKYNQTTNNFLADTVDNIKTFPDVYKSLIKEIQG